MTGRHFTKMLGAIAAGGLVVGLLCGVSMSSSAATSAVTAQRTTDAPIQTTAFVKPAANTIGPVAINCGFVTCSAYLSRSATKDVYEKDIVGGGLYGGVAVALCRPLYVIPPLGVACSAGAAVQAGWISQELKEAATQHGARGACLKVTYTRTSPPLITYWSTNNGQYCKN